MPSFIEAISGEPVPESEEEARREAVRYANASSALEGLNADQEQLALQEEFIKGNLTPEQAIEVIRKRYTQIEI